MEFDKLRMCAT